MADPQAYCCYNGRKLCLAICLTLCLPTVLARPSRVIAQQRPNAGSAAGPAASSAVPGGLKPGTPAVVPTSPSGSPTAGPNSVSAGQGNYGWLFPVLSNTKRGNCVVYEVSIGALGGMGLLHQCTYLLCWSNSAAEYNASSLQDFSEILPTAWCQ